MHMGICNHSFNKPSVQLYGDAERSATPRLDDLVVRLCRLIYRKTKRVEPGHA
jgi:hypothetical protein